MHKFETSFDALNFLSMTPKEDESFFQIKIHQAGKILDAQMELFRDSNTLIIAFHGSINQKINPYPVFQKKGIADRLKSNVLSIADPTLQSDSSLNLGWYLGFSSLPAQKILIDFINKIMKSYGFKKIIFMGGSGGGFAALFFSWNFPESIVLVSNPQTVLIAGLTGRKNKLKTLIDNNFGGAEDGLCLNVCNLYQNGFANKVIYLQNGECKDDLKYQTNPFLDACMIANPENLILKIDYWGISGHSGSVPFMEILKWVNAINALETHISTRKIYQNYFELNKTQVYEEDNPSIPISRFHVISEVLGAP